MAMLAREVSLGVSLYRPDELPTEGQGKKLDKLIEIRRFHEYHSHPSRVSQYQRDEEDGGDEFGASQARLFER